MQISPSDFIATFALLVAIVAVFYAKESADAARLSNRVAPHQPRAAVLQAMFGYRRLFIGMDAHPTDEEIQDFYVKAVLPATICLPGRLTSKMHELYIRSMNLCNLIDVSEASGPPGSKWDYIQKFHQLGKEDLDQLIRDVTAEIDVGDA